MIAHSGHFAYGKDSGRPAEDCGLYRQALASALVALLLAGHGGLGLLADEVLIKWSPRLSGYLRPVSAAREQHGCSFGVSTVTHALQGTTQCKGR